MPILVLPGCCRSGPDLAVDAAALPLLLLLDDGQLVNYLPVVCVCPTARGQELTVGLASAWAAQTAGLLLLKYSPFSTAAANAAGHRLPHP